MRLRVALGAALALIIVFAIALGGGRKESNQEWPQCSTGLPSKTVYAGQMDFKPGATDLSASQGFNVSQLSGGGIGIQDRSMRVGMVVSPGSVPNETIVSNDGDDDLILRTNQGCVDKLPAYGEVRYGEAVTHIEVHYLTELSTCEKLPPAGAEYVGALMVDMQLKLHVEDDLQSVDAAEGWTITDSRQTVKLQISMIESTLVKVALAPNAKPVVLDLENVDECNVKLSWLRIQRAHAYFEKNVVIKVYRFPRS